MRVVGYTRTSTDKQTTSINKQIDSIKSFCEGEDEFEYGGKHDRVEVFQDADTSGSKRPITRSGYGDMVDHLESDSSIEGIVVHEFDRLTRDPIDIINVKPTLERDYLDRRITILQTDSWIQPHRSIPPMRTEAISDEADGPNDLQSLYFNGKLFYEWIRMKQLEQLQTRIRTWREMISKKERGEPAGRPPRGVTTDKQVLDKDNATLFLPDPDGLDTFVRACAIISRVEADGESAWSVGKDHGFSSPSMAVKRLIDNKDIYLEAYENARAHHPEIIDDLTGLRMDF